MSIGQIERHDRRHRMPGIAALREAEAEAFRSGAAEIAGCASATAQPAFSAACRCTG